MRYSLLNMLGCQHCHGELTAIVCAEADAEMAAGLMAEARRANRSGALVGPVPTWRSRGPLTDVLSRHATAAAPGGRSRSVVVREGLLVCGECGRWYPVTGCLPELLPDHLRDAARDADLLAALAASLPADLAERVRTVRPEAGPETDAGAHHKRAEIAIKDKVDDPGFFGPGYTSPFNPWNPDFTVYLIRVFANVLPLLELKRGDTVLDTGCGYAWTTEWMFKSGFEAIGVDISRTYVDIAVQRMGAVRPHLVIADVEHLPVLSGVVQGVLAYESFHHVPDRNRAMRGFCRVLSEGGVVVLAEPGGDHEHAQVAVDAMAKYGILEKGMELADVEAYLQGTTFAAPEQIHVLRLDRQELGAVVDAPFARDHAVIEGNVFRIRKDAKAPRPVQTSSRPRPFAGSVFRRVLRAGLRRLDLGARR